MENSNQTPLYPTEAYENKSEETKTGQQSSLNNQNALLPLLLSMIQGNKNNDLLKIMSTLSQGENESKLVEVLANSLKKNKKTTSVKTEIVDKKPFPKNEYVYWAKNSSKVTIEPCLK